MVRAMFRLVVLAALAACGTATDDRPTTLPYITEAILQPTCGLAECHSTFTQAVGDVFDTVEGARASIVNNGLVVIPDNQANPAQSRLIQAVTVGLPSLLSPGSGKVRMPYDAPMPSEDIKLLEKWIAGGARGAQCIPSQGNVCVAPNQLTECLSSGDLGAVIMTCPGMCIDGACQ